MLTRGFFYAAVMMAVLLVFGLFMSLCFSLMEIDPNAEFGVPLSTIIIFAALFGFGGSLISLFLSKTMVKWSMKVQIIETPSSQDEIWLVDTVKSLAAKKGVGMPEVGIYPSNEMNAFATGWNRNSALVCVSRGLLSTMSRDECEAVLGHEMSHVSNGDMVTSSLLQGVLNTFVYATSTAISMVVAMAAAKGGRNSRGNSVLFHMIFRLVNSVLQIVFGIGATMVLMKFSRWREYRADAGAAEAVGADKMIAALEVLQKGESAYRSRLEREGADEKDPAVAMPAFCISDPRKVFMGLMASHPPLNERIRALKDLKRQRHL